MSITIKELAQKMKLSPSAISLALNGKSGVSEATRQRIVEEAAKYDYKAHKSRQKILENVRFVIFLGDLEDVIKETSFYSYVLQGIEDCAKVLGYNVLISYYRPFEDPTLQLNAIASNAKGIILLGTTINHSHLPQLQKLFSLGIPLVIADNYIKDFHIDCVVSENTNGVYDATKFLLKKGYYTLGYVRSKITIDNFVLRREGFNKACREANLNEAPCFIDVGISSQQAFDDMNRWLSDGHTPPRALIADNDVLAAACIRALKAHGYQIPQDVAIIGFDNMPFCTVIDPPLSAVNVNKHTIGWIAMTFLHNRILSLNNLPIINDNETLLTYVSTNLVEREST